MTARAILSFAAIGAMLIGCGKPNMVGKVMDVDQKPLADVNVKIRGSKFETKTDLNGQYRVEYVPGVVNVVFTKDGYSSADRGFQISEGRAYPVDDVVLMKQPPAPGGYFYRQGKYTILGSSKSETVVVRMRKIVGIPKDKLSATALSDRTPGIVLYGNWLPESISFNMNKPRVVKLKLTTSESVRSLSFARPNKVEKIPVNLWTPEEVVNVKIHKRLKFNFAERCWLVDFPESLDPGAYAVDVWGAFSPIMTSEKPVYVFQVIDEEKQPKDDKAPGKEEKKSGKKKKDMNEEKEGPPLGLAALIVPADNPMTPEKVELGKMLYFDARLSKDGKINCATCHNPKEGWTERRATSKGIKDLIGGRNSPTVINAAYHPAQFWDGRSPSLEDQALGPIENPIEMGENLEDVVNKLKAVPEYVKRFRYVFGTEVNKEGIAKAIAAFERTVLSGNSPYDKFKAGDDNALSGEQKRGLAIFADNCANCHKPPTFSNGRYCKGVKADDPKADAGRKYVTKKDSDFHKFRVPHLRDIENTGPYFHDGSCDTLEGAVALMAVEVSDQEKKDLVAFLKALSGEYPIIDPPKLP